jgi:5-formyltetrahydrofolate cyclo-ligase
MSDPAPLSSGSLKRAKRAVRRSVLAARDAVGPGSRREMAAAITQRFLALPAVQDARVVMAFSSFGSEVATAPLIDALHGRGVVVALPQIVDGDLRPRRYEPGDPMTETSFGALEPSEGAVVDPVEIDVVVTPAVAFDRAGARVGYGGGYYDRFLLATRPDCLRVGVAFGVQILEDGLTLPGGTFDLGVDVIVTESETLRCRRDR